MKSCMKQLEEETVCVSRVVSRFGLQRLHVAVNDVEFE